MKMLTLLLALAIYTLAYAQVPKIPLGETFVYSINGTSGDKYKSKNIFVDLFDASSSRISTLKKSGRRVICYFSAGSYENWRADKAEFKKSGTSSAIGKPLDGWDGENWLDYRNSGIKTIMAKRIQMAKDKGCQGVDPDNVDGHLNKTGFPLSAKDQKSYLSFLSQKAHSLGLLIGLKNSAESVKDLEALFDFVVIEECYKYKECSAYNAFKNAKKAMFHLEYNGYSQSQCDSTKKSGGSLVFANLALTKFQFCK